MATNAGHRAEVFQHFDGARASSESLGFGKTALGGLPFWPGLLLSAALLYNALLCFVNAQVMPLSPSIVIAFELAIVAAVHVVAIMAFRPEMRPWYVMIVFLCLFAVFRTIGTETLDVKYLRDVLLIPTFILLGLSFKPGEFVRWLIVIHTIVLFFMFYEALFTDSYSQLFNIRDYYINTRGYQVEDFWNTQSTLYVSASRPNERIFFAFLNLHRVSSVFLEPVSLGNYCVIITGIICALYKHFTLRLTIFLAVTNFMLIVACDGRLAMLSSIMVCAVALVVGYAPRRIAFLYLPLTILLAFAFVVLGGLKAGGDDFPSRVAHTVNLLQMYGTIDFMGLSDQYLSKAVDSGIAYLIMTQSLLGVVIIWCFITLCCVEDTFEQKLYVHATCLYIMSNMLVSFALLTIKTAALLWVVYGMLQVHARFIDRQRA